MKLTVLLLTLMAFAFANYEPMKVLFQINGGSRYITLPLGDFGDTTNVIIDWGDGTTEQVTEPGNVDHEYSHDFVSGSEPDTVIVTIAGKLTHFGSSKLAQNYYKKVLGCSTFGELGTTSFKRAFYTAINEITVPDSLPYQRARVTNLNSMFKDARKFNSPIGNWDVSEVTDMANIFYKAEMFNQPIGNWDVSKITDMTRVFAYAEVFNQDLSKWDVSNVTNFSEMFAKAGDFNQPIGNWDVSKATTTYGMFRYASQFNQPLDSWKVDNVTDMSFMFAAAYSFNQPLSSWNVSKVTLMKNTFGRNDGSLIGQGICGFNQPIGNWDVSNVTDMSGMFSNNYKFNQDLSQWDVSSVTDMSFMFFECGINTSLNDWDVSSVTNMKSMFECDDYTPHGKYNQPLSNWDVSSVTNMSRMFFNAPFNQDIRSWNTEKVTTMAAMFQGDDFRKSNIAFQQNIGTWNLKSITSLSGMFKEHTLEIALYDSILIGWANQETIPEKVGFHAGNSWYSNVGAAARQKLVDEYSWNIIDSGNSDVSISNAISTRKQLPVLLINGTVRFSSLEDASIKVFGVNGRMIKEFVHRGAQLNIQELGLAAGRYYLQITQGVSQFNHPVLIQ